MSLLFLEIHHNKACTIDVVPCGVLMSVYISSEFHKVKKCLLTKYHLVIAQRFCILS
jgi:hypothetical protein